MHSCKLNNHKKFNFAYYDYLWKTFEFVFPILFVFVTFFCKMAFSVIIVASSFFLSFFILELPPIYTLLNSSKTPLTISVSCFIPWLNCISHLHYNSSCNNCPHTNPIDNWSMQILNESIKVWQDGGKFLKNVNAKSSSKSWWSMFTNWLTII